MSSFTTPPYPQGLSMGTPEKTEGSLVKYSEQPNRNHRRTAINTSTKRRHQCSS